MKPDIRWQLLLASTGLLLVLILMSYQVQSAALCTITMPATGGTFIEGMVGRPNSLNPLLSDPYPVDREINNLIFDGLVRYNEKGQLEPALAREWTVSEDGLTFTFILEDGVTWHDGRPVTTADVAFTYGLMQDEDFPGPSNLVPLWQSVTINPIDERQIAFTLTQPYAPFFEATTRGILPAHLLENVPVADLATHPFNQAPIGTGPFMVQAGQDWASTGRLRLSPNPASWRQGVQISDFEFRFFANADDLISAFRNGEIHAVNGLSPTIIPQLAAETSARIFTSIAPRYSALFFNLSESGAPALQFKEVRQAIGFGLNREALVDTVFNGQGILFDGPYLPDNWAARPELMTIYNHQPDTAGGLLDSIGWVGAGTRIREGVPLVLKFVVLDAPEQRAMAEEIASQLSKIGIETQITLVANAVSLRETMAERQFDMALVEVAPPSDPDLYDLWSQEAIVRGHNYSGWNNRRASEALESGRQIIPQGERAAYYEAFLRQFDADLPALTLYQHVDTYVMSEAVKEAEIGLVWEPRDRYQSLPAWFLNFRDVTVSCPQGEGG